MADIQTATAEIRRGKKELERGPMPNVRDGRYGAQPIGGAVCDSSVIQFLVPHQGKTLKNLNLKGKKFLPLLSGKNHGCLLYTSDAADDYSV